MLSPVESATLEKARFSVHNVSANLVEVRFSGELPVLWPERLAAILATQPLSIQSAEAERTGETWNGSIQLATLGPDDDISQYNFTSLLNSMPPERKQRPVSVLHHGLVRLKDSLRLAIQAEHRQGSLADLLTKLKHLGLYARRLTIDTRDSVTTQCFWLTGYSGREPDVQTEQLLREFIASCRKIRRA